jgi:gamma-glutamylputrescine oxidase
MRQLSIWEKESFFHPQDVIIVGSGFSGLWSALQLKLLHPDHKITILERGLIPTGASTRNAGFSCFGSPSEIINDAISMGEEELWKLVAMRYHGLKQIRRFFRDEQIDYSPDGGYECFKKDSPDWIACEKNLVRLNMMLKVISGEPAVFTMADEKLTDFGLAGFDHLVENKLEGCLHPGKLVRALLKKVQALDVQVITGIEVVDVQEAGKQVQLFTNQELVLVSRQVLLCTNAFTQLLVPSIDVTPHRGQVLMTTPIAHLKLKGAFHFDRGFYYFRNLGDRLLLGGARHKAIKEENSLVMATTPGIQVELEKFIREHLLPDTPFEISDRWTGIMAMGEQKSPLVQRISENVFCCVRMNGMGVALAPVVAQQVALLMDE